MKRSGARWPVIVLLWIVSVAVGMAVLVVHQSRPGMAAAPPVRWPATSRLQRADGVSTLVMLAHPLCPCTRASLAELARLMPHVAGRLDAHVVFLDPNDADERSQGDSLRARAAAIPGVAVHEDPRGDEAKAFGSFTSGQTLLYAPGGDLQFAGGITAARGHEGDSAGRDAIIARVLGEDGGLATMPVFGCALRRPDEMPREAGG